MKKLSTIFILLITASLVFSQHHFPILETIEDRYEKADFVFEGKIIQKIGFWNPKKSQIFTKNIVQVNQVFKGDSVEFKEIITQGGEVDNDFQYVFHSKEFQVGTNGLFFCKYFEVPDLSKVLMINGQNGFINLTESKLATKAYDQGVVYENVQKNIYSRFPNQSDKVKVLNSRGAETIEFDWDNIEIIGTQKVEFDLYAKSITPNLPFGGGEVYVKYSTLLSGQNAASNNNVSIFKKLITNSSSYSLSVTDFDEETLKILISADCATPSGLYNLSNSFEKLFRVSFNIQDITQIATLGIDEFQMDGNVYYYNTEQGCIPFDNIIVPNDIEQFLVPTIISHDTIATAGTGFMLNIKGMDFGTTKGDVLFRNADSDSGLMGARDEDIIWTDTLIQVRVPSTGNGLLAGGSPPAGSGFFEVRTSSPVVTLQSPKQVDIQYAVYNYRNANNDAKWAYFGEDDKGDGNKNGILTFRLGSTLHSDPIAKTLIDTALCQWTNATKVEWDIGAVSPVNTTADNDSINLIYFAPNNAFFGSSANATAFTKITGSRIQPCNSNIRFIREVDIVIRQDLTALNPPANGGYHFNRNTNPPANSIDFYSIVLHELGHAHLLRHALPDSRVMYPFTPQGVHRRTFNSSDIAGGKAVLDSSAVYLGMFPACATAIKYGGMCLAVSTKENLKEDKIVAYPNPFYSSITLEIPPIKDFSISLYNSLGQNVFKQKYDNSDAILSIGIDQNISPGIYYLTIEARNKFHSLKLIKL